MSSGRSIAPAAISDALADACHRRNVPGAALGIWHDGRLQVAVHGVLNVDTGELVRPDSMFQIGSVTKVLTATLVMQLVDEGRLELDAPVRRYLPAFRTADLDACRAITVRQLLNHTSGLAGDFLTDTGGGSDRLARYLDRCALLPQVHAPGAGFSYCNSGYCVAGRLIEVATGVDFDTALKARLFDALELRNSISRPADAVGRSVSAGHSLDPSTARNVRSPTLYTLPVSGAPAGATPLMSVSDLIDFARMHLQGGVAPGGRQVLSETSARMMQDRSVDLPVPARDIARWGLGWFIVEPSGGQFIGHDGATVGQSAYLRVHRESSTIAALFVNGGAPNDTMLDVFGRTLDPLVGVTASPPPRAIESPTADLSRFAGRYSTIATDVDITVEDGRLVRTGKFCFDDVLIAEPPISLQPSGINQFMFARPPAESPTTVSFLEFDRQGRGSTIFSGLRLFRRTP